MPLRYSPVARVHERVAGLFAVDEHPPTHPEMHPEPSVGICRVEKDLLADTARRHELVADERIPERRRRRSPLEEPRIGRVHAKYLAVKRVRVEDATRRFHLENLR